jgi:hypothetical protein
MASQNGAREEGKRRSVCVRPEMSDSFESKAPGCLKSVAPPKPDEYFRVIEQRRNQVERPFLDRHEFYSLYIITILQQETKHIFSGGIFSGITA